VAELRCVDGSLLRVDPVPCRDRGGVPYEITLELRRDGAPFGSVGERCGYLLATIAVRLVASRGAGSPQARCWPDPDDRFPDPFPFPFPVPATDGALDPYPRHPNPQHADQRQPDPRQPNPPRTYPPLLSSRRELELFAFRRRDRDDAAGTGELRCTLRTIATWMARPAAAGSGEDPRHGRDLSANGGAGRWRLARRAVMEAWGSAGDGVRAVLTSAQLAVFLAEVLDEAERAGASYRDLMRTTPLHPDTGDNYLERT
jgi:hypothetical protein